MRPACCDCSARKFLKRGAINKYVEAEIMNHSKLRHPHVIQFKVGRDFASSLPCSYSPVFASITAASTLLLGEVVIAS